jgi:predicted nuclease of restriction endonuclease-like (RecB) superfamily
MAFKLKNKVNSSPIEITIPSKRRFPSKTSRNTETRTSQKNLEQHTKTTKNQSIWSLMEPKILKFLGFKPNLIVLSWKEKALETQIFLRIITKSLLISYKTS